MKLPLIFNRTGRFSRFKGVVQAFLTRFVIRFPTHPLSQQPQSELSEKGQISVPLTTSEDKDLEGS